MAKKMPEAMDYTPVTYDPQYILMVNHLKKYFPIKGGLLSQTVGHVKAVDGVTFNLRRGCTMGLVGESGCGKSTTGRTILRLSGDKTGGQVLFNGKEVYDMNSAELRELRTKMQIDLAAACGPRGSAAANALPGEGFLPRLLRHFLGRAHSRRVRFCGVGPAGTAGGAWRDPARRCFAGVRRAALYL